MHTVQGDGRAPFPRAARGYGLPDLLWRGDTGVRVREREQDRQRRRVVASNARRAMLGNISLALGVGCLTVSAKPLLGFEAGSDLVSAVTMLGGFGAFTFAWYIVGTKEPET